jgi:hypothetical protein
MTALIDTLDDITPYKIGEKGHIEYGWSGHIREQILQFSFQTTRTDEAGITKLQGILKNMLKTLKNKNELSLHNEESTLYLSILYRIIGHTRDIIDGKGEYTLAYMMIYTWYEFYQELSLFALTCLVDLGENVHQYGSWKDIKYFCEYCRKHGASEDHPLICHAIMLANKQLRKDYIQNNKNDKNDKNEPTEGCKISLVSKWIPRESSSFQWLFHLMAVDFFPEYMETAKTEHSKRNAALKCKTHYRKILSCLNKKIDTLQIKQCNKDWIDIDFNKVTSISLAKQKKAFLNDNQPINHNNTNSLDRIGCSDNFKAHIDKASRGEVTMKGKRVGLDNFTKQAIELISSDMTPETKYQYDLLNAQWNDNSTQTGELGNFIAMVDVSGSMDGAPKHVAIALGIRVAEKSKLGKRIMTFSEFPSWVNLEQHNDFVSMVETVCKCPYGLNTNFYAALNLILDAIIDSKLPPEEVGDMVLAIFSDMQIDQADTTSDKETMYDIIKEKYAVAGMRLHGKPFKPPHILLWNLKSTDGFPCLSTQPNVSMMSGFSPVLLNIFCEQGIHAFNSGTPWSILIKTLENDRYKIMGDKLR